MNKKKWVGEKDRYRSKKGLLLRFTVVKTPQYIT